MAEKSSFAKTLTKEGAYVLTIEGLKAIAVWAWPWVITAVTLAAGHFEHFPWVLTIPAATFVFAATMTGLLRYDEWRYRRTARDKLNFGSIGMGADYTRDSESGRPIALTKAQAIIVLQSTANFPISYVVDEISASFDGMVNPRPTYANKGGIIGAMGSGWYRDDIIDMKQSPLKENIKGVIKFIIRYGRPGAEKYLIIKSLNLSCRLDSLSGAYLGPQWQEAAQ